MEVRSYIPHLSLQAFVLQLATVKVVLPEGEVTTPYPPTPFQSLMFYCNDPVSMSREYTGEFRQQPVSVVLGPQVSRVNIRVHGRLNAIRVDFLPGGLHRLLGIPMWELLDEGLDAADVFGAGMRDLNEQLRNTAGRGNSGLPGGCGEVLSAGAGFHTSDGALHPGTGRLAAGGFPAFKGGVWVPS